jgi:hypothetical protein
MLLRKILPLLILTCVPSTGATPWNFEKDIRPALEARCVKCHGPEKNKGDLRLDVLKADFSDRVTALAWLEVRDQINLGEMPPDDAEPLTAAEIEAISGWIAGEQRRTEKMAFGSGGKVVLRRLNRDEYTHTVEDLLHLEFPPGESPVRFLPPDGTAEGFDKMSAALLLDPSLMKLYYEVGRRIADRALVLGPPAFPTEKMRLEFEDIKDSGAIGYLTQKLGMKPVEGGLELIQGSTRSFGMLRYPGRNDNNVAPISGSYRFTLRTGGRRGVDGKPPHLEIQQSHPDEPMKLIAEFDVEAPIDAPKEYSFVIPRDHQGGEISVSIVPGTDLYMSQRMGENFMSRNSEVGDRGDFAEVIRLQGRQIAEGASGERATPDPEKLDTSGYPMAFLDWFEVEGPLYEQWPPRSHQELLFKSVPEPMDENYVREMFARFLPRAFRRPVDPAEVEPFVRIVTGEVTNGQTFIEGARVGLAAVLTSPHFLFLLEPNDGNESRRLGEFELASRLSYLLWSSMPDEELMALAGEGRLSQPTLLAKQVDRMIADPKSSRFVDGFARQWLRTNTFLSFAPDKNLYKAYHPKLGEAAVREPLEFFSTILQNDLSVLNFIDSDFVVINQRLAEHYGIPGVVGDQFRRVDLPADSHRGGLLGMMGVHMAGADGNRTKPVARAVYVREVLFNDPPDPPPPNAGEIEPNIKGERLTVRDRLLQHQQIESCATCHRRLDPYGLALENFNVIGQWRDEQDGEDFRGKNVPPITVDGSLPNGSKFSSFDEFRSLLARQDERFRRGLAEKLLTYALGRPVGLEDDAALAAAIGSMKQNGDSLRALIKALVASEAFQRK